MNRSGRRSTLKMVAEKAGVGTTSVSRVLADHPDVSEEMRQRVLRAAEEVGYQVDLVARALRSGDSRTVGIMIGDLLNPFLAAIVSGASDHLRSNGYAVLLATSDGTPDEDLTAIRSLMQHRVSGLIVSVSDERPPALTSLLTSVDAPVVQLDRDLEVPGLGSVWADHAGGMQQVADHLVSQGHRRIGLIVGSEGSRPTRERVEGLRHGLRRLLGGSGEVLVRYGDMSEAWGYEASHSWLADDDRPTAFVCGGNQITVGFLRALSDVGLSMPDDVSLVACDDVSITQLFRPGITVVARDALAMGTAAAGMLVDKAGSRKVVLPTHLIVRGSTRAL
ncbi:LacI family DNA-binding transcriptional regulator [uncultured Serinicoccus sp.]|uniref:LacI family DNA-binding transcriptional regulator n=1 Tax=uncultured Serinicoccus sp. TaxID=735514 RepID=UPI00262EBE94|nr:LacI family DNA-binding transcriptional regulator [uncultured Serinicoccus sp.]